MNSRLRPKLTYSNVIATIALFVALGGAAVAAGLPKNSVGTKQLKRGAVTAAKLQARRRHQRQAGAEVGDRRQARRPTRSLPGNIGNGAITSAEARRRRGDRRDDQERRHHHQQTAATVSSTRRNSATTR